MQTNDTRNATTHPIIRMINSIKPSGDPNLRIFRRLAPAITGTAMQKVNSAAVFLSTPIKSPPMIVEPDLDVPGRIADINWKSPMISASL